MSSELEHYSARLESEHPASESLVLEQKDGIEEVAQADVVDEDNIVTEELSRFSSPSRSQSSSCNSISNPFYDGPSNFNEHVEVAPHAPGNRRISGSRNHRRGQGEHHQGHGLLSAANMGSDLSSTEETIQHRVVIFWDLGYLLTCPGFLHFIQLVMTTATLACLVSAGRMDGGLLNLPLSWHFRIMIFIAVLTLLVTLAIFIANLTSLIAVFGFEWTFFDMLVYGLFAFLYLVGSSLVASAFDFYEKMKLNVSVETINQLVTTVILGYICMVLYGLDSFLSYRKWKVQFRLYQRRKLIEEDEINL